jgi:SAM-dependent methyltransferase
LNDLWWLPYVSLPCCGDGDVGREQPDGPEDTLTCATCGRSYQMADGVLRLQQTSDYAESFAYQWSRFSHLQIDHLNGTTISADRLRVVSGGSLEFLEGAVVYDAGCGAGRYTAVAAAHGARVVAADLGLQAVQACRENTVDVGQIAWIHADSRRPPVRDFSVDVAFSIGVYQHTPDPLEYLRQVLRTVKPGGRVVVWGYERSARSLLHPRYVLRQLTTRVSRERLLRAVEYSAPGLLRVSNAVRRLPGGRALSRAVPIANYQGQLPLAEDQLMEWAVLDTFDWLSPRYDHPIAAAAVEALLVESGFEPVQVEVDGLGFVAVRIHNGHGDLRDAISTPSRGEVT